MNRGYREQDADTLAEKYPDLPVQLLQRVYTARLIGMAPDLVLHGGGNASVKTEVSDLFGKPARALFVKASGYDMAVITPEGFTGLYLDPLKKLKSLEFLSDEDMENQLSVNRIKADSAQPSVEALLHAFIPYRFVDHSHSDSILVLTNQKNGMDTVQRVLGKNVVVLPYEKSGFPLALSVFNALNQHPDVEAIVIMNHGIFTFGDTAKVSYHRMIEYVERAGAYIREKCADPFLTEEPNVIEKIQKPGLDVIRCVQVIRGACAYVDKNGNRCRLQVETRFNPFTAAASRHPDASFLCDSGVLTPDHAVRTRNAMVYIPRIPEKDEDLVKSVKDAVAHYREKYLEYLRKNGSPEDGLPSDFYPMLFLVSGAGLVALGKTRKTAAVAADIAEHTLKAKIQAQAMAGYEPIPESHVFHMEFWSFQLKKVDRSKQRPLEGQVAVVTGGGGAIGFGIADRLLDAGAAVVITDIDKARLENVQALLGLKHDPADIRSSVFDVTDFVSVENAFKDICLKMGGIDILVPNAGIAHVARIEDLDPDKLDQVIAVNLKGTFTVMKAVIPVFRRQGTGGNIVLISSKNVVDPGAAFSAYSSSKAGAHQMAKIAALELADLGVRVNMINPDAVFGDENVCSGLWECVGPDRMKSRGLDPQGLQDYYCSRSLLKAKVLAEHVGNAVVFFCSELTPTTGAALPVDGGNPATFSR